MTKIVIALTYVKLEELIANLRDLWEDKADEVVLVSETDKDKTIQIIMK